MAGSLSTLGLGSQGALSYDIIDKLKAADEAAIIKPIDNKIYTLQNRQNALNSLTSLIGDFRSSVEALASTTFLDDRKTEVSGTSVTIEVQPGSNVDNVEIDVTQLATRDMHHSKGFSSKDDTFASGADTITLTIGGESFDIDVDATTTLSDLVGLIEKKSDGKINASILNTGGDEPFELILTSKETGTANNITMSSTGDALSNLSMSEVQNAQDASFTYNGIQITRGINNIDDLITGISVTLKETGKSKISIEQDNEAISQKVQDFVDKYNEVIDQIKSATTYDPDTKTAGALQGLSEINALKNGIQEVVETVSVGGKTLQDAGIEIDRYGKMSFDKEKFTTLLNDDPAAVTDLFSGDVLSESTDDDGVFTRLKDRLKELATNHDSMLKNLSEEFDEKMSSLEESKAKAKERLENRYEIMARKFASFDAMIGQINNQFSALNMVIQQQLSQKQ